MKTFEVRPCSAGEIEYYTRIGREAFSDSPRVDINKATNTGGNANSNSADGRGFPDRQQIQRAVSKSNTAPAPDDNSCFDSLPMFSPNPPNQVAASKGIAADPEEFTIANNCFDSLFQGMFKANEVTQQLPVMKSVPAGVTTLADFLGFMEQESAKAGSQLDEMGRALEVLKSRVELVGRMTPAATVRDETISDIQGNYRNSASLNSCFTGWDNLPVAVG